MKSFYSINPGEFFVAEDLSDARPDLEIYFPFHDVGVDLLAVPAKGKSTPVRIQVKESRPWSGGPFAPHSWHTIRRKKIDDADIFVFVTYLPKGRHTPATFERRHVVIPRTDLKALCRRKKISSGKFTFYFCFGSGDGRVLDCRENPKGVDVTRYVDAWHFV